MAQSEEESGTAPPAAAAKRTRRPRRPSLGKALVVEDDGILAMMVADALRDGGASHVSVCPSIASAVAALERFKPDILVLDVHLADRDDGWTMAELVLELNPTPPIIIFSTGAPEQIPARVAGLGSVLVKPFAPEDLVALCVEARGRRGLFSRLRSAISSAAD